MIQHKRTALLAAGQVQGVGFRPFIYRLAVEGGLSGSVGNTSDGVRIEVQGPPEQVDTFAVRLRRELPPLARLTRLEITELPPVDGETEFVIVASHGHAGHSVLVSPDVGICEDCLKGNFAPCVKKRCVKGSRAKSLLAAAEAVLYRMRGSYNKIDCYITPSGFYRDLLQRAGFTKAPIRHIPNFLPGGTVFAPVPCEAQAKLLYLGRLTPEKGLPTLLNALAACPDACLEIAGEGPQRAELEQQVRDLGLGDRVKFLGFLTGQPLTERLNACRAVVLPSEWYENGPYSVMEALAVGKPVLGSRIGGIPEMVQEGQTGFLFRPGDAEDLAAAIGRLYGLTEEGYLALCRSAAAFAAETFSEEAYLAQLLPIYERLIGKR